VKFKEEQMQPTKYIFNFKGGPITVWAMNLEEAKICAQAEAIRNGWDFHINGEKKKSVDFTTIDKAIMYIIEIEDADTFDEQLDCIEALKKLRTKLKNKENAK
jgi:hypothetical protein